MRMTFAANGGVELVQRRRTMNQEWNTFFDSHLYDGRVIHMLVIDQSTKLTLADIQVGIHILANYCHQNDNQPVELPVRLHEFIIIIIIIIAIIIIVIGVPFSSFWKWVVLPQASKNG